MLVQFTIPNVSEELAGVIDACVARCVERWGGCTVTDGMGWWIHPTSKEYVAEPVVILGVECQRGFDDPRESERPQGFYRMVRDWFDNLATYVREKGNQHTVYYRIFDGGEARFVGPETIIPTCIEDRVNAKMQATADAVRNLRR